MFGQQTMARPGQRPGNSFRNLGGPGGLVPQTPQAGSAATPPAPQPPASMTGGQQYRASVAPFQAQKDMAAFGALQNLGVAGMNAMGQYGINRDTSLANQSIAAANAFGSMGNAYYNTMGQLGNYAAGLSAAGLNAGAQSAFGSMGGNFDMDMGGNLQFGGGGGFGGLPGFGASGPEGMISSGRYGGGGGGGRGGLGAGFNNRGSGSTSATVQKGSSAGERSALINQGYGFLNNLGRNLNDPNNQAMALAGLMQGEFGANRAGIMDPSIVNSLNSQVGAGYGALGGLYGMSDYGFNTGRQMPNQRFAELKADPNYWASLGRAQPAARRR